MAILKSEAQRQHPAPDSGFDGAQRFTGGLGDLLLGASAIEGQLDGPALGFGQRAESAAETTGALFGLQMRLGRVNLHSKIRLGSLEAFGPHAASRPLPQTVESQSAGDHDHPGQRP